MQRGEDAIEVGAPLGEDAPALFETFHHAWRCLAGIAGAVVTPAGPPAKLIAAIEGAAPDPIPVARLIAQHRSEGGPSTLLRRRNTKLVVQIDETPFKAAFAGRARVPAVMAALFGLTAILTVVTGTELWILLPIRHAILVLRIGRQGPWGLGGADLRSRCHGNSQAHSKRNDCAPGVDAMHDVFSLGFSAHGAEVTPPLGGTVGTAEPANQGLIPLIKQM